jgi:predicted nucleic acid-binding protein
MDVILDTNAVSAVLAGEPAIEGILKSARVLVLPAIVAGEYRYGISASRIRNELTDAFEQLLQQVTFAPVDQPITRQYAALRHLLKQAGTPIPENDVWIAATVRHYELPLLSRDAHFDSVPELKRVSW